MRIRLTIFLCLFSTLFTLSAEAVEPALEFIQGLRQRRYYDTALQYMDKIEQQGDLPDDIKTVIPYERAQTLLESAKGLTNLDLQRKQLDASQASFESFVKGSPNHPLAGQANTARGRILLEKARVEIWDGDKPSNEGSREKFRDNARTFIQQARVIFQQAQDQHQKAWEAFPTFIPEDEKQKRAERDRAENLFMEAQLDLAQCTYWEAQTYDKGNAKRKEILTNAANEFEAIHQKYRSMIGGLFARMWQGKCFEEQDEIGPALGIYEELLGHEGKSNSMVLIKDRALRFRLICLNHEKRKDYALVVNEGQQWLNEARARARTDVGLGIQYEICVAQEALGTDRTIAEAERKNSLNQALNRARGINRYPGELKSPTSAMIQRIMVALNRDPGDPKDFDTAYGNAGQLWEEVNGQNDEIRKAKAAGDLKKAKEIQESQIATAGEMTRLYDLALKLVEPETDERMVALARLRLSYGYLLQKRFLDAAVIADHQMSKFGEEYSEMGREAGFIAMSAFDYAYSEADENDRDFERRMVQASAQRLVERWPESDRANDARNVVARLYWQNDELVQAAQWWDKIPQGTSQYMNAQISAGKAYWRQYVIETSQPAEERASAEDLTKWKEAAIKHLEIGLAEAEKTFPAEKPLTDDLVGAKLTLVNIRNLDGIYQSTKDGTVDALDLLTKDPHSVLKAVDVPKGQERPKDPSAAKSRQIASFAYQQLLRAQIGVKNLDEARKARAKLEEVAAGEDEAALTQVFVDFGRELQQELERLKASNETERLEEVRSGFEAFLNDLFNRQDGQTFYSLLWIAETYTSLADGSADNPSKADDFFNKASEAYKSILSKAASDPSFTTGESQVLACKLRLVNCLRRQRDFESAEEQILDVLKSNPNAPDAQFEAARLYQEWGGSGGVDSWRKFEAALAGKKEPVKVWGWGYTAQSLQRALYGKEDDRLEQLHFDARYNLSKCEYEFAESHPDVEEAKKHMDRARSTIVGFAAISKAWPESEYTRFNELYKQVLAAQGSPVVDLPPPGNGGAKALPPGETDPVEEDPVENVATNEPVAEKEPAKSNTMLILLMLVAGAGAVGGLYFVAVGGSKKKYADIAPANPRPKTEEPVELNLGAIPESDPAPFALPGAATAVATKPKKVKAKSAAPGISIQTEDAPAPSKSNPESEQKKTEPKSKPAKQPEPVVQKKSKPAPEEAAPKKKVASQPKPVEAQPEAAKEKVAVPKPPASVKTQKDLQAWFDTLSAPEKKAYLKYRAQRKAAKEAAKKAQQEQ